MANGKGRGWHGESRRHSLARKGIKTVPQGRIMKAYGIKYDANGQVMIAEGVLKDLWGKAKSFVTESKIYKKITGKPRTREEQEAHLAKLKAKKEKREAKIVTKPSKEDIELEKQVEEVGREIKVSKEEELEQASHFGTKPSKEAIDIDNKGRVGALKEKIASEEKKVPKEQLTDMPEEVFESPDADSIIAIAENTEKLIDYNNELKHDIRMIEVERKRLKNRFQTDEHKEFRDLKADRQKARADFENKRKQLKMSSMDESKIRHKIAKLESEYKQEHQQREVELGALRNRNRVTLQFMDDLTKDLSRNVRKIDKKVKQMTASGQEK